MQPLSHFARRGLSIGPAHCKFTYQNEHTFVCDVNSHSDPRSPPSSSSSSSSLHSSPRSSSSSSLPRPSHGSVARPPAIMSRPPDPPVRVRPPTRPPDPPVRVRPPTRLRAPVRPRAHCTLALLGFASKVWAWSFAEQVAGGWVGCLLEHWRCSAAVFRSRCTAPHRLHRIECTA